MGFMQELAPEQQEPDAPQQPSAATRITTSASAPRSSRRIQGLEPVSLIESQLVSLTACSPGCIAKIAGASGV